MDHRELLLTTYSDQDTLVNDVEGGFDFFILNPTQPDGSISVFCRNGRFTLAFYSMEEEMEDFGELVGFIDEIIADETVIFEVWSRGENLLGGSRGTDEIKLSGGVSRFLRSLSDGDPCLLAELRECVAMPPCHVRLRGWRPARRKNVVLS